MARYTFAEAVAAASDPKRGMEAAANRIVVRDKGWDKASDPDNMHTSNILVQDAKEAAERGFRDIED